MLALVAVDARASDAVTATPLAPVAPSPAMRFTRLAPAETGLIAANPYDDPAMWADRFQEFKFGAIGTGVAVADYDGDGRPDVYVTVKTGEGRLYRNRGEWRFEDVTEAAGLGGSGSGWMRGLLGRGTPAGAGCEFCRREQRRAVGPVRVPVRGAEPVVHQSG